MGPLLPWQRPDGLPDILDFWTLYLPKKKAQFGLKLKKVGKTTDHSFKYDVSQIPYDYTVEVTNRLKELDLIDRVPEELWTEVHDIVQEAGIKTIHKQKKCKKTKWLSQKGLLWIEEKQKAKEKKKDIPIWKQSSKEYQGEIGKPSSLINAKNKGKQ